MTLRKLFFPLIFSNTNDLTEDWICEYRWQYLWLRLTQGHCSIRSLLPLLTTLLTIAPFGVLMLSSVPGLLNSEPAQWPPSTVVDTVSDTEQGAQKIPVDWTIMLMFLGTLALKPKRMSCIYYSVLRKDSQWKRIMIIHHMGKSIKVDRPKRLEVVWDFSFAPRMTDFWEACRGINAKADRIIHIHNNAMNIWPCVASRSLKVSEIWFGSVWRNTVTPSPNPPYIYNHIHKTQIS